MNILRPNRIIDLTEEQKNEYLKTPIIRERKGFNSVTARDKKIGFLSKAGVFIRWSSYTITLLVAGGIFYVSYYGFPPVIRHVELSYIEARVEEAAKSLANLEDKIALQQESVTSLILWQQEESTKAEKKSKK